MKCFSCGKDNPIISEIVGCKVSTCRNEVIIPVGDDRKEINYSVLCSQHQNKLSSVELKLFEWEELIENRMGISSD